ncbi:chemotaxis protein CheW [Herbaspirillum frisingense]|uniref:Chemotaxis protein CheW n=1 Tax=Herbaspirillum frisingense GSF30 TaxID=864073 RepID=A0AAI9ICW4_9BURK|nr:chemotaxis protein CheW [Herbaspirillum frisingense]EOA03762.1 chemotaxis protein CheW [Herbaspirillum frisingense GSF30]UIN19821.1 chemotaxis protein CheW [Herbaspirillum frisingense]
MAEVMPTDAVIDDCWNRIGTKGDGTCPELQQHLRCLNCPTFARAALQQLDRIPASAEVAQQWMHSAVGTEPQPQGADASALVVRIGGEWLAIATTVVQEVAETRPVHSLPHQRNPAISGVLNIRGALRICVSLAQLLQLQTESAPGQGASHLLVTAYEGQTLVFPVEQVVGVHRYAPDALAPVPTTLAHATIQYTRGMVEWRGRQIGLLDHELLFYVLNRSMT